MCHYEIKKVFFLIYLFNFGTFGIPYGSADVFSQCMTYAGHAPSPPEDKKRDLSSIGCVRWKSQITLERNAG